MTDQLPTLQDLVERVQRTRKPITLAYEKVRMGPPVDRVPMYMFIIGDADNITVGLTASAPENKGKRKRGKRRAAR